MKTVKGAHLTCIIILYSGKYSVGLQKLHFHKLFLIMRCLGFHDDKN
jgi:hypothetical protein